MFKHKSARDKLLSKQKKKQHNDITALIS